jgi:Carboxypeptidase regulatory-like domain
MTNRKLQKSHKRSNCYAQWVTLLFGVLFAVQVAMAQVDQGTITGLVHDGTGAVVPNAEVTVRNIDTGLVLKGTTNGSGIYVFSPLKIGNYTVSATAKGFETT